RAAYSSEQLDAYYQWKIDIMTVRSIYTDASHARKEGLAEGRKEGLAEGESKKGMEIALNMLKKGMFVEDISDVTGLSKHQIEELKEHIK
ncbi:MAG: hypothetical protein LBV47_03905, partial [Bacteroidales bacterium]|nr:hypothetical protein [Bacteroidales bacterium]